MTDDHNLVFVHGESTEDDGNTDDARLCYTLGKTVMEMTGSGFVIIGSPNSFKDKEGRSYPTGVSVLIAEDCDLSKSEVGYVLEGIAASLSEDVDTIEDLANE